MSNYMNKKGFTLIELLAVIIIIALIAVIAFPNVTKLISGAKSDSNSVQFSNIEKALKLYISANGATINSGDSVCISTLKSAGFLENKKIVNPDTKVEYTGCFTLTWDENHKQYNYTYSD